ncbi:hypothetical protein BC827DRAFT_1246705 [Russula dissimulans]|nr:hypothetical protein BC827DRAFT_1246705 [Russula dissimulans]
MSLNLSCLLIWSLSRWMKRHARIKQLNDAEIALQREETAHKRNHLSEEMKRRGRSTAP